MRRMRSITVLCAVMAALAAGCASYTVSAPEGFAYFEKETRFRKFVSADGVRFKVQRIKNYPYGDAEMWRESVDIHLKQEGYHPLSAKDISTPGNMKGAYAEYQTRYNAEDYIYSVALFVDPEYIYLFESGGQKKYFDRHREALLNSIRSLSTKN